MNRNLIEIIYGRFSLNIAHFVLIHLQTWSLQAIIVSQKINEATFSRKVLYKVCSKQNEPLVCIMLCIVIVCDV